ncbi:MAG: hypothetical protein AB7O59_06660 [Pirellulales bacterium]
MFDFKSLIRQIPGPMESLRATKSWLATNGVWWAASTVGHVVVLSGVLLLIGTVAAPRPEGEAPSFESDVDTGINEPALDHFDVGETPLEPTELTTDTLNLVDAPVMQASNEPGDAADPTAGGGSAGAPSGGIGGLDQFDIKALGPGPAVRGGGLAASGSGRGIGSGGEGSGFGARGDKDSRRAMIGGYGGTKASERAVAAALNWFARHQNADGSWGLGGFVQHCDGTACTGPGNVQSDTGATALALLPFLAAGQTQNTKGPYRRTVQLGLEWLIRQQKQNGDLHGSAALHTQMYSHGLCAITLCEAYALTKDSRLRIAAEGAIRFIEAAQIPATGGWHYEPPPKYMIGDTSVVGWQVMALKSAQMAGLEVSPAAIEGAHKWLKLVAKGPNKGLFSYNLEQPERPSMTSVGLLCTQYLGAKRDDPAIQEGIGYLMARLPDIKARDTYYWYYATQVMHNVPGPQWDTWNRQMRRVLIDTQVKEGCAAGSWDPHQPQPDPWRDQGGRIMVTSLCCLTLEVYYRYLPLYKLDEAEEPADSVKVTSAASPVPARQ